MNTGQTYQVLAVVAHPDDESFGLGAVISWLRGKSVLVKLLVFTYGEASSIGAGDSSAELGDIRVRELASASDALGLSTYYIHSYGDGRLKEIPLKERVRRLEEVGPADAVLAFDNSGITRHPDHIAATEAAIAYATGVGIPVYLWTLPVEVAAGLNRKLSTSFQGRRKEEIDFVLDVGPDRARQWKAIHCHRTQAHNLGTVQARLELLGTREHILEVNRVFDRPSPFR